jgi:hypothetical protein
MSVSLAGELQRCVQPLAQPASVQAALFPEFAVAGDEPAIAFDEALRVFRSTITELSEQHTKL